MLGHHPRGALLAGSVACIVALSVSCDDDAAAPPAGLDVAGWWKDDTGSTYTLKIPVAQEGDTVHFYGVPVHLDETGSGTGGLANADGQNVSVAEMDVADSDHLTARTVGYRGAGGPHIYNYTLARTPAPEEGAFTITGTIATSSPDIDSQWPQCAHDSATDSYTVMNLVARPFYVCVVSFDFDAPPASGAYTVGTGAGEVDTDLTALDALATYDPPVASGTVTVTVATASRFAGSFNLTLTDGAVTGTFDSHVNFTW